MYRSKKTMYSSRKTEPAPLFTKLVACLSCKLILFVFREETNFKFVMLNKIFTRLIIPLPCFFLRQKKKKNAALQWRGHFFWAHLHGMYGVSLVAQTLKRLPAMRETWIQSLGWEDHLEKEMPTHSSILAWKTPRTEEPGRLQSMGSQWVRPHFTV